jgi:PadR family transcriptional regulator, regulatory protein PadR
MSTQKDKDKLELLQGTLDLLILRTLIFGPQHGQGIARAIQETPDEELLVEHGALYPALQRLEERGWISAKWGTSSINREARFYTLNAAGTNNLSKKPQSGGGWRKPSHGSRGQNQREAKSHVRTQTQIG